MTLRDKARAVKEAGEKERGNWAPEDGSVPLKLYQYWAKYRPNKVPKRENFCHYWRVVLFWAPFLGVRRGLSNFAATRVFIALMVAMYIGIAVVAWVAVDVWGVTLVMALIPYILLGLAAGITLYDGDKTPFLIPAAVLTAPISMPVLGIGRLHDNRREGWTKKLLNYVVIPVLVAVVAYLGWLLIDTVGILSVLIGVGILAALCLAGFGIFMGCAALGNYIGAVRRARRDARDAKWEALTYEEKQEELKRRAQLYDVPPSRFGLALGKFFHGIGDFLVLLGQVVRVNKWKMCPLVDIPKTQAQLDREKRQADWSW